MEWKPGSKQSGFFPIQGGGAELPVTMICGDRPGCTVLISGGVHSSEYVGIQAAIELAAELTPEQITGNIIIIHLMNPSGYAHRTMSVVFEDGKNLNRVFPGCSEGTMAERIACTVTENFFVKADAYIDLHSGDGFEELIPYVYFQGAADRAVAEKSRAMAEQVDVRYMVPSKVTTGGAYNHAGSMGVPGILIERGGLGIWSREEVEADRKDVRNVLRLLGVLDSAEEKRARHPEQLGRVVYMESEHTGCWYPRRNAGDRVRKGEVIGEVRDFFGNILQVCQADFNAVILYLAKSLSVTAGGPVGAYGEIR